MAYITNNDINDPLVVTKNSLLVSKALLSLAVMVVKRSIPPKIKNVLVNNKFSSMVLLSFSVI